MRRDHVIHLICPKCRSELTIVETRVQGEEVEDGELVCRLCSSRFPIVKGIPRFVPVENYASGFGLEWTLHARTQYDRHSGIDASERRFFEETGWPRQMPGEMILEVGSGSGRFTEHAASTDAFVVSVDFSYAVEANHASNGGKANVLVVQADVFELPLRAGYFDRLFCFGMLQHTPDVRRAFAALGPVLKPGGRLVVDVYAKTFRSTWWATKTYLRPITRRMNPDRLYRLVKGWTDLMWPVGRLLRRVPIVGKSLAWHLLIADYSSWGLSDERAREWAYLDTFDMLAPRYDSPQTLTTLQRWFVEDGYEEIDVRYGYNGVEGRGRRPQR